MFIIRTEMSLKQGRVSHGFGRHHSGEMFCFFEVIINYWQLVAVMSSWQQHVRGRVIDNAVKVCWIWDFECCDENVLFQFHNIISFIYVTVYDTVVLTQTIFCVKRMLCTAEKKITLIHLNLHFSILEAKFLSYIITFY